MRIASFLFPSLFTQCIPHFHKMLSQICVQRAFPVTHWANRTDFQNVWLSSLISFFFPLSFLLIPLFSLISLPLSSPPDPYLLFHLPSPLLPLPGVQPRQLEFLGSLGCLLQKLRRRGAVRPAPMQQPAATEQRALLHGEESHLSILQRHTMSGIKWVAQHAERVHAWSQH